MERSDWSRMLMIVEIPGQEANNYGINVNRIKQVRGEWSLDDKIDRLIAGLRAKAPFCKLSLFRNKGRGPHE
jgi:hypothetical protein